MKGRKRRRYHSVLVCQVVEELGYTSAGTYTDVVTECIWTAAWQIVLGINVFAFRDRWTMEVTFPTYKLKKTTDYINKESRRAVTGHQTQRLS